MSILDLRMIKSIFVKLAVNLSRKSIIILFLIITNYELFSQHYYIGASISEKLCYNKAVDGGITYINVPGNNSLQRDLNQDRLMLYSLFEIPISLSFGFRKERMLFEFGLQTDRVMKRTGITAPRSFDGSNSINVWKGTEGSARNIYGFMLRCYYQLSGPIESEPREKGFTRSYIFGGIDFFSPMVQYTESGWDFGYLSENKDTISIVPTETYHMRLAPRLHFGFTFNVFSKNGHSLFNIKTYWGTNSFITIADYTIKYHLNGVPFHMDYARMSLAGWYFVLSKDFWFKAK